MKIYLIWNDEIIDETDNQSEADYLIGEYNAAYGGGVSCTTSPNRSLLADWEA